MFFTPLQNVGEQKKKKKKKQKTEEEITTNKSTPFELKLFMLQKKMSFAQHIQNALLSQDLSMVVNFLEKKN